MRKFGGFLALLSVLALAFPANARKKRRKKKKAAATAPIDVELHNACAQELALRLTVAEKPDELFKAVVPAGGKVAKTLQGSTDTPVYELHGKVSLGYVSMAPGAKYRLELRDCRVDAADLYTVDLRDLPPGVSPHAASKVRFRARKNLHLEYKAGKRGRFKPLSIAMTRPIEVPAGDFDFTFRLRAAKRGPVMKMFRKTVKLVPGRQHLIEANLQGGEIIFKFEDERIPEG